MIVHAGFAVETQRVADGDGVQVRDLPVVEVASTVYRGSMDEVGPTYEALMRWIDDSGYRLVGASRELYHAWCPTDHSQSVTEIQLPIARS